MFESMNNFRPIGGKLFSKTSCLDDANLLKSKVFRSARVDKISEDDLSKIKTQLGIKSVIDFRDFKGEYKKHEGDKLIDRVGVEVLDVGKTVKKNFEKVVWLENHEPLNTNEVRHCMIDLLGKIFVINLFCTDILSIWKRIVGVFLSIFYILFKIPWIVHFIKHEVEVNELTKMYIAIIDCSGAQIACVLKQMCVPGNLPCIICCHVGKDRTGIVSALLLSIMGHDVDTVVNDYSMTEQGMPPTHEELQIYAEHCRYAPRSVMYSLMKYIDNKYGGVPHYLQHIGFSLEEQKKLKMLLSSD